MKYLIVLVFFFLFSCQSPHVESNLIIGKKNKRIKIVYSNSSRPFYYQIIEVDSVEYLVTLRGGIERLKPCN